MSKYRRTKERLVAAEKKIIESEKEIRQLKKSLARTNQILIETKNALSLSAYKNELFFWTQFKQPGESDEETRRRFYSELSPARGSVRAFQSIGFILLQQFDRICRENGIEYWLGFGALLGAYRAGKLIPWDDDVDVCMMRDQYERFRSVVSNADDFESRDFYGSIRKDNIDHLCKFGFREPNIRNPDLDIFIYDYCESFDSSIMARHREIRREMVAEALRVYELEGYGGKDAFNYPGNPITEVYERYRETCSKELGFKPRNQAKGILWAIDNYTVFPVGMRSSAPIEEVFPLSEIELEGSLFLAPHNVDAYIKRLYGDYLAFPNDMVGHQHFKMTPELREQCDRVFEKYGVLSEQRNCPQ